MEELSSRDLRRAVRLTAIATLIFTAVLFIAAFAVPFSVNQAAIVTALSDDAMLLRRGGQRIPLIVGESIGQRLSPGQGIELDEGETATLTLAINGGIVELVGPAEWVLVHAYRRGTARDHFTDHARFVLTLEQRSGTARYDFASADPDLSAIDTSVRLPLTTYVPDQPCWEITIAADGSAIPRAIACP